MNYRFLFALLPCLLLAAEPPNVILMMTDDQGIGDFGVMGNTLIETPNIDAMATGSASMSQFYVSPVCSPTRACLMTGRYNHRTRCIDTWVGRSMMDTDEVTMAECLQKAGYATGIFGKWHLGDCYPMRPQDQGFDEVLVHRGGGLAQPSEPLKNQRRYTDPILYLNGKEVQTKGFCTDVYTDAALTFIDKQIADKKRFFIYLPTNAPHGPYHDVPEALYQKYLKKDLASLAVTPAKNPDRRKKLNDQLARIAAMITNEDENLGRVIARLEQHGILENTLVIRMNDNGPNSMRYVGDMRGMKSHVHEGGIRSPLWMHWPDGLKAGTVRDEVAAHIDLMPTILEACGAKRGKHKLDGRSLLPALTDADAALPDRPLVIQSHRGDAAVRYHHFMIREGDWKLLNASGFGNESLKGEPKFELYNLAKDPGEKTNVYASRPGIAKRLKAAYDKWFDDVGATRPDNYAPPRIVIGTPHENPTALTRQDWRGGTWHPGANGHWLLNVDKPVTADLNLIFHPDALPAQAGKVTVKIQDINKALDLSAKAAEIMFKGVKLNKGPAKLVVEATAGEKAVGLYQVEVLVK